MNLSQRDLLCTQEWSKAELEAVLDLAVRMKRDRFASRYAAALSMKTFLMLFFNPSTRTRLSFECAATELGGHAQWLDARTMRMKLGDTPGETIEDAAQVMSSYAAGLGIRLLEDQISYYGQGDQVLREYARWSNVPVISMAHDKYHPCQGLADVMGWIEKLSPGANGDFDTSILHGKKLLITWGGGILARSWSSVQEALLIGSRFGMDVTLAHPEGFDLDPQVIDWAQKNTAENGRTFTEINDPAAGYAGAHVVYSRHWVSPQAYQEGKFQKQAELEKAQRYPDWICDAAKMQFTDNALFTHPMPVDRNHEVTDQVASGPRSCIYTVAENRLHVQKAIMALTMGQL